MRSWTRSVLAVAARPGLWPTALRQGARLAPDRWWGRPPFLPLPDRSWLRFRMETAYGGDGRGGPRPDDLVTFLEWSRAGALADR
jgi:hypothetical protein